LIGRPLIGEGRERERKEEGKINVDGRMDKFLQNLSLRYFYLAARKLLIPLHET